MRILKIACIAILVGGLALPAFSETVKRTSSITAMEGTVHVKTPDIKEWEPVAVGAVLNEGDVIKTGKDSWAFLNLDGQGETASVEVSAESELTLAELIKDQEKGTETTLLDLAIGEILIRAQKLDTAESKFEVKTPTSVVGVRGTKFAVKVEALEE